MTGEAFLPGLLNPSCFSKPLKMIVFEKGSEWFSLFINDKQKGKKCNSVKKNSANKKSDVLTTIKQMVKCDHHFRSDDSVQ